MSPPTSRHSRWEPADLVQHQIVSAVAARQQGVPRVVFKGGTLLRVCYRHDWRFSEDLDFDWIHTDDSKQAIHDFSGAPRGLSWGHHSGAESHQESWAAPGRAGQLQGPWRSSRKQAGGKCWLQDVARQRRCAEDDNRGDRGDSESGQRRRRRRVSRTDNPRGLHEGQRCEPGDKKSAGCAQQETGPQRPGVVGFKTRDGKRGQH